MSWILIVVTSGAGMYSMTTSPGVTVAELSSQAACEKVAAHVRDQLKHFGLKSATCMPVKKS